MKFCLKIGIRRCSIARALPSSELGPERQQCCGEAVDSVELLVIWEPARDASVVALRRTRHGAMCSLCPRLSRRKPLKTVRFDSFVDTISYCDDLAAAAAPPMPAFRVRSPIRLLWSLNALRKEREGENLVKITRDSTSKVASL